MLPRCTVRAARPCLLSACSAYLLLPMVSGAAETESVAEAPSRVIEEVLITARRRTENLQEVPDSITVFDQVAIEDAGIQRLNDVAALTPNLRFSDDQEVGVGTVTMRGITQQRGIGETPVAFVVDGVTVNNSLITTQDLFDVEQIEVLRGPQGALYGRNSVAGAINITTRQPTSTLESYVKTRAAEGNDLTLEGALSGPMGSDRVLGRLAYYWQDRDGQLRNEMLDEYVDFKDSLSLRGKVLASLTDALSLEFRYQHAEQEGGSGYFMPGTVDNEVNRLPGDLFPFPLNNTTFSIQSNLLGVSDVNFDEYTLKFDYEFPAFTLTSITGYNDLESNNDQDLDQTGQEFLNILVDDDATQSSQEFRLISPPHERLRWLVGGYYSDQERDRSLATFLNVAGFLNGGDWSTPSAMFVPQAPAVLNEKYETLAFFGQVSYDFNDDWELTVAGRWDDIERTNNTNNPAANGTATFDEFQPKVQLTWSAFDDLRLYAIYSEGFRPGGFNTLANDPAVQFGPQFDSEKLQNYELGFKYATADNRYVVNAALFYIDYTDQQFFLFDPFGSQALINAAESEILGGEFEATMRPSPGLLIALAYGFADSEIKSMEQVPGLTVSIDEILGNSVPNAPDYTWNVTAQYTHPVGSVEWFGRLDFERRGTTYFTIDSENFQETYNIVDYRLGVSGDKWTVTAFVDNLFNEEWIEYYFSRRFVGLRTDIAWPSPPRQFGLEATYRF